MSSATDLGRLSERPYIGCHGYEHLPADTMGRQRFRQDLKRAKAALEDASRQTGRSRVDALAMGDRWVTRKGET